MVFSDLVVNPLSGFFPASGRLLQAFSALHGIFRNGEICLFFIFFAPAKASWYFKFH